MSREKQIEEMAFNLIMATSPLGVKDLTKQFDYNTVAKDLYELYGWRKQEWISVDERLPDKEGTYLTYTDKDKMLMDIFCIYPSHGTEFWVGGNGKVTHWMPLPPPPKENKND